MIDAIHEFTDNPDLAALLLMGIVGGLLAAVAIIATIYGNRLAVSDSRARRARKERERRKASSTIRARLPRGAESSSSRAVRHAAMKARVKFK